MVAEECGEIYFKKIFPLFLMFKFIDTLRNSYFLKNFRKSVPGRYFSRFLQDVSKGSTQSRVKTRIPAKGVAPPLKQRFESYGNNVLKVIKQNSSL